MRSIIGLFALLLAFLAFVAGVVLPAVAESTVASRIEDDLGASFNTTVEATVVIDGPFALLRGEVRTISLVLSGYRDPSRPTLTLGRIEAELTDVLVDFGAAVAGALETVEVGTGVLQATINLGTAHEWIRVELEAAGLALLSLAGEPDGLHLVVAGPDGTSAELVALPSVRGSTMTFGVRADDDPASTRLAEVVREIRLRIPQLPLGVEVTGIASIGPHGIVLSGELSGTVPVSTDS